MSRPMDYLPQGYPAMSPYREQGELRLDESTPPRRALYLEELNAQDAARRAGLPEPPIAAAPADDSRLKQIEATHKLLFTEVNAIKKHLGLKDG